MIGMGVGRNRMYVEWVWECLRHREGPMVMQVRKKSIGEALADLVEGIRKSGVREKGVMGGLVCGWRRLEVMGRYGRRRSVVRVLVERKEGGGMGRICRQ